MRLALFALCLSGAACASAPAPSSAPGAYLAGRFAARFNDVEGAARSFEKVAAAPVGAETVGRRAFFFLLTAGDVEGAARLAENLLPPKAPLLGPADARRGGDALPPPDRSAPEPQLRPALEKPSPEPPDAPLEMLPVDSRARPETEASPARAVAVAPARMVETEAAEANTTEAKTVEAKTSEAKNGADDASRDDVSPEGGDGLIRLALAARAMKRGEYPAAMRMLDYTPSEPFIASATHLVRVWARVGADGPTAGLAALDDAEEGVFRGFDPTHEALLAEQAGRLNHAREAHQLSVFGLGGPVGRAAYGAFLERAGETEEAQRYYELIAAQPGPDRRIAQQGLARLERGRASRAYANVAPAEGAAIALYSFGGFILEQFAEQRERAAAAGFTLDRPRYNIPLALAQMAIYLSPDLAEARRLVGAIFSIYEDQAAAAAVLEPIPPSSPHYVQARIDIAGGLARADRAEEGIAVLQETVQRFPDADEARFSLANLLASERRYEAAIDEYARVIERAGPTPPSDAWRYFVARGDALLNADRWRDAEADLRRAVDLAPDEPTALNYLGYVWAERGVNLDEAFPLIEKALSFDENSGAITDSLGWAYYQTGQYEEAAVHLERAAALEPADPTITDHLGDVYWRLGRVREARYQWRHALELKPTDKQRADIERKLNEGLPPADASGKEAETN